MKISELLTKIAENPEDLEAIAQARRLADELEEVNEQQKTNLDEMREQNRKLFKMIDVPKTKGESNHEEPQQPKTFEELILKEEV